MSCTAVFWLKQLISLFFVKHKILVGDSEGEPTSGRSKQGLHVILSSIFLSVSPGYLYVGPRDGLRLFKLKCSNNYHKQINPTLCSILTHVEFSGELWT